MYIEVVFTTFSFNLFNSVPIWTRWNTRRSENNPAKQLVCYRKPIQLPPTTIDIIKEAVLIVFLFVFFYDINSIRHKPQIKKLKYQIKED